MAYKRRKQQVEQQIKEHNQAKLNKQHQTSNNANTKLNTNQEDSSSKCPFAAQLTSNVESTATLVTTNNEANSNTNENKEQASSDFKLDKKVTVSIQSNEEKLKENILGKLFSNVYYDLIYITNGFRNLNLKIPNKCMNIAKIYLILMLSKLKNSSD
jgi:hypothetical protein